MIGGSLGVALATAIFQTRARVELEHLLQPYDPSFKQLGQYLDVLTGSARAADIVPAAGMEVAATVTKAFDVAVAYAMVPSVITAVIGVGVAVLLLRGKAPASDEM